MTDDEGNESAPGHYQREIHINAWIMLAAWQSSGQGQDRAWLEKVFPIISSVADGACSRAERDPDGSWHLRAVLPPDESVTENPNNPGQCNDSVSTNTAFRTALRAAVAAAKILGQEPKPLWSEVADGLVILKPGPDKIIPEYEGYSGHDIKQADVILIFWPLNEEYPDDIVRANLDYYREKVTWGPLMTEQIDACIRLRHGLGEREAVLHDFIRRYRRYTRGVFETPYECIDNTNSLMLTACGGLIAALAHGWFGANSQEDIDRIPRLGCA
jgi:trehalose/maltose hydrolase-like predicted phosphorylase